MSRLIYNIFLFLYVTGIKLISPWNKKARLWIRGRYDLEDHLEKISAASRNKPVVWMHCASLGEFEQGRPLLEMIREHRPGTYILLSFFSPSGYKVRKNYPGADAVIYLPIDSAKHATQFLNKVKPKLVLWVKYEYWYYFLKAIASRNIPLLLVSGIFRPSQPFFKFYGALHRSMLSYFTHMFVQNEESVELLATVNHTSKVTLSGDTRFDRVANIVETFQPIQSIEKFCGSHSVIVAGSTWPDDEEELDHFANTHPDIKFIIAPHEIGEEHLKEIEKLFRSTIRFSKWQQLVPEGTGTPNVLIIDNIGMLSRLYHYATVSYIGGGFGDDGIHNALEAAVHGKPVVFGPVYEKFFEAVELIDAGAAFSVNNALELEDTFTRLLGNDAERKKAGDAASEYVISKKGASSIIMKLVEQII